MLGPLESAGSASDADILQWLVFQLEEICTCSQFPPLPENFRKEDWLWVAQQIKSEIWLRKNKWAPEWKLYETQKDANWKKEEYVFTKIVENEFAG